MRERGYNACAYTAFTRARARTDLFKGVYSAGRYNPLPTPEGALARVYKLTLALIRAYVFVCGLEGEGGEIEKRALAQG